MHSAHFSGIGTSTLRFENVEELSKVIGHHSFSSVLASSACVNTVIETYVNDEVLYAIDMVNGFRADRKYLLLLVPTFDKTMFKNITINYAVTIDHIDGGEIDIIIHVR